MGIPEKYPKGEGIHKFYRVCHMSRQECGLHPRLRRNIWKIFGRAFLTLCFIDIFLTTVTRIWSLNGKVMNLKNYWLTYLGLESLSILASVFRFNASHTSVHFFFLDPGCHSSSCFCILPSSPKSTYQLSPVPPSNSELHLLIAYQELLLFQ